MQLIISIIAERLKVRMLIKEENKGIGISTYRYIVADVPEYVKSLFTEELLNHMAKKARSLKKGDYFEYLYNYGTYRPLGKIMYEANDNLAEVLSTLPKLKTNAEYFLPETFLGLEVDEYNGRDVIKLEVDNISSWILEDLHTQR